MPERNETRESAEATAIQPLPTAPALLRAIYIGPRRRADLEPVAAAEAVAGHGLRGDRFFREPGTGKPEQEVTLIEQEALDALAADHGIRLGPGQSRRNLVTQGVALNDLVGKEFLVGAVRLRGIMPCDPCGHLEKLTYAGVKKGLHNRGGLRAQIITGGLLRTGDPVCLTD
jgi:MOSC domain-containing protein YiiM